MSSVCAYCRLDRPLTKEHIWPKGFIKRTNYKIRYSAKAPKTFSGEMTIRDVCYSCNNGPLSNLDAYACELFDEYFKNFVQNGEVVSFKYHFSSLTRWLLKVA